MNALAQLKTSSIQIEFTAILSPETNVLSIPRSLDQAMVGRLHQLSKGKDLPIEFVSTHPF